MLSSKRLTRSPGYPLCLVWLVFALASCAPWHDPTTDNDAPLRARAVTEESHSVRVSAAVLSAEDSKRMFGADLYAVNVQPVWLEVTNRTAQSLWLFRTGADGGHFYLSTLFGPCIRYAVDQLTCKSMTRSTNLPSRIQFHRARPARASFSPIRIVARNSAISNCPQKAR